MPPKARLRAGAGAKATVLTRFIVPKQHLPGGDKQHVSEIVLIESVLNDKGKDCYSFKYADDESEGMLLIANSRYVHVTEEGDEDRLFEDEAEGERGRIKWKDSQARRLLYMDILKGNIPMDNETMTAEEIFIQRPEFAAYDIDKFRSRLTTVRKQIKERNDRAAEDKKAFDIFISNHEVALYSRKGYIEWQGSESQKLAIKDLEEGLHNLTIKGGRNVKGGFRMFYESRPEYYEEFEFNYFSDRIRQEIKTKKYLHTLKVRGKLHKAS
jgi:hypothetical protein